MKMRILIAAGGTGGHLYPGIAIAEEFMARGTGGQALFVTSKKGLEKDILQQRHFRVENLEIEGIRGRGVLTAFKGLLLMAMSLTRAIKILRHFNPDVVIGVGGYSCVPVILAALLLRQSTYLQEQNIILGLANRMFARWVSRVFTSFPQTEKELPRGKAVFTGNPIRSELLNAPGNYQEWGLTRGRFTVLVFGGSQGAHRINQAMLEALKLLVDKRDELQFIHQTGTHDYPQLKAAYQQLSLTAAVFPYIHNMAGAYSVADLVICRAGATSIAELTVCGKPAILIPYPYAAANHQWLNAQALVASDAAIVIPDKETDGERLAAEILRLHANPEILASMRQHSRALGQPDAASKIVSFIFSKLSTPETQRKP